MPTAETWYVDPGASGSNDGTSWANAYTVMSTWENAKDDNITAGGGGSDKTMTCYFRSSGAHNADTTGVGIYGWTTDATHWVHIYHGQWESPVDGSTEALGGAYYNTGQYRIEATGTTALGINEDYVTVRGIQCKTSGVSANSKYTLDVSGISATNNAIEVTHSYFMGQDNDSYYAHTVCVNDSDVNLIIYNCVGWNKRPTPTNTDNAFQLKCAAGSVIYNCTAYGGYQGFYCNNADSVTAKNCLAFNTTNHDFNGTFNAASDYNVSEDTSAGDHAGGGGHSTSSHDSTGFFDDEANGDFRLNASIDHGVDLSGTFTDDIAKVTRNAWDVGADEYVATVTNLSITASECEG